MNMMTRCMPVSVSKAKLHALPSDIQSVLEKEGVLDQIIQLNDWIGVYARSLPNSDREVFNGLSYLEEIRENLQQHAEELMRLENEGGLPATKAQETEAINIARALKRVEHLINIYKDAVLN